MIVGLLAAWLVIADVRAVGSAVVGLVTLGGSTAAFVAGRASGTRWKELPASLVVAAVIGLIAWSWSDVVDQLPSGRPFGYANATGALLVQGAAAASLVAAGSRSLAWIVAATFAAGAFVAMSVVVGSTAGAVLATSVLILAIFARSAWRRTVLVTLGGLMAATLVITLALGWVHPVGDRGGIAGLAVSALSERRVGLWSDALRLAGTHALGGVGVGRFDDESRVARSDVDARHAHHEYLELAAETGVAGGVLLAGIFAWPLIRLGGWRRDGGRASIVGAAVAALAIHACVDYVLHFPVLPIMAAFLLGTGLGCRRQEAMAEHDSRVRASAASESKDVT